MLTRPVHRRKGSEWGGVCEWECMGGSAWEGSVTNRSSRKWSVMHSVHGKECVEGKEVYGR